MKIKKSPGKFKGRIIDLNQRNLILKKLWKNLRNQLIKNKNNWRFRKKIKKNKTMIKQVVKKKMKMNNFLNFKNMN